MIKKSLFFVGVLCGLLLPGCPGQFPQPPFDASGTFVGTWTGSPSGSAKQAVVDCPLTLTLTQNLAAPWPQSFGVSGTALVDYDCFDLPDFIPTPAASAVPISGIVDGEGNLTLLSGACGTGACVVLSLTGVGIDADDDGFMETYDGAWAYTILIAGVEAFGFTGTYTTDRVTE
jgi:hypothetical protein